MHPQTHLVTNIRLVTFVVVNDCISGTETQFVLTQISLFQNIVMRPGCLQGKS